MTTALALIESAMSKIGMLSAGETVSAEDAQVCLNRLNTLVDAMEQDGMFSYTTLDTVVTLPSNTTTLTIGPSQQINMVRPVKILQGSFCRVGTLDYRLTPISEQEYNLISQKSSIGAICPSVVFYDGQSPIGNLYFWPTASTGVELHLITPEPSGLAADLTTGYAFPPGYARYIEYALAIEIAPDFNVTPTPMIVGAAANAKRAIRRVNARTPQLDVYYPNRLHSNSPSDFIGGY
jgi:hypothetical protein